MSLKSLIQWHNGMTALMPLHILTHKTNIPCYEMLKPLIIIAQRAEMTLQQAVTMLPYLTLGGSQVRHKLIGSGRAEQH